MKRMKRGHSASLLVSRNDEQEAVVRHEQSLCLSAGAGSGKTRTLVGKYIKLLVEDGRPPSDILAITFTEKAAAEMRIRIRDAIKARIAEETDPLRGAELETLLGEVSGGWISTIHSFGARVLREHPAEAGVDPVFAPLPEQESRELWESAAVGAVLEQVERDPLIGEMAYRMGLARAGQWSLIGVLYSIRTQLEAHGMEPDQIVVPDSDAVRLDTAPLRAALDTLLTLPEPGATLQKRAPIWKTLIERLARPDLPADQILRNVAQAGWDADKERLKPGGALRKPEKEAFAAVERASQELVHRAASVCQHAVGAALKRLAMSMWRIAEAEKARRRALDFGDLERKTLQLLDRHPEITASYQERFKHILVDEYQDVNTVQARLVRQLAGDRPHCLFAVGDPKQSIYLFRGADIGQFFDLWDDMEKRGAAFELKRNFRSHPMLVNAINAFFDKRVFGGKPPVAMMAAKEVPDPEGAPRIRWLKTPSDDTPALERREREALIVAQYIRELIEAPAGSVIAGRKAAFGDVTMLFRATPSLYIYEEAFRRAQIPYELVKAGTAFRSQEVLDLLNAVTVVVDPGNAIGWLGFLRSPLAGLSDDGIFALSAGGDLRRYFLSDADFPSALTERDRQAARVTRDLFRRAIDERRRRTPLSFLDWLITESGYAAIVRGLPQAAARFRYIDAIRSVAVQYSPHRPDPFAAFLDAAWRMVARNERESGMDTPDSDCVRMMTIHQAKGLEFPIVILPDLLRPERNRTADILLNAREATARLSARVKLLGVATAFPTAEWSADKRDAAAAEQEEYKRLLYVAMTRAQDLLILPGPDRAGGGQSVWERIYGFLRECPEHVESVEMAVPDVRQIAAPARLAERLARARIRETAPEQIPASVEILTPTSFKPEGAEPKPATHRIDRGSAYASVLGTIAHDALQHLDLALGVSEQSRRIRAFLKESLKWTPVPEHLEKPLQEHLIQFLKTPLAARLRAERDHVRRELPFVMPLPGRTPETFVRGKIDLLILTGDGVEIYDYKYQEPRTDFDDHEGQLMAYALAACRAFDLAAVTVGIQFLMGDQRVVKKTVTDLEAEGTIKKFLPA